MNQKKRILGIDALRGLAASFVMLWHLAVLFFQGSKYPSTILNFRSGIWAVWLFYGISGYVISMTLERIDRPFDFAKARFMRLYPTFIVGAITTFIIVNSLGLPGRELSFDEMLINLTMVPKLLGIPYLDESYWSLEIEWFFYLLMFFVLALNLRNKMKWVTIAMLVPILVTKHISALSPLLTTISGRLPVLESIHYFVPGLCIYHWNKEKKPIFLTILVAFFLIQTRMRGLEGGLVTLVTTSLLYAGTNGKLEWITVKPLMFMGTISYSVYLLHQNIGYAILQQLLTHGVESNLAVILVIGVIILISSALNFWVEKPTLLWYKSLQARRRMKEAKIN